MTSPSHMLTALSVDGFHQHTTSFIKGNNAFLDLHGAWAGNTQVGVHYFNIQYRTPTALAFIDCTEKYKNNKNLYAMTLPPSCTAVTVNPKTSLTLNNRNTWTPTDVTHSFTLSKQSHVIIMYQYAGVGSNSHTVMHISINSVPLKHTVSITRDTSFVGNFGLWQGFLNVGGYKVTLEYCTSVKTTNYNPTNLDWENVHAHMIWYHLLATTKGLQTDRNM